MGSPEVAMAQLPHPRLPLVYQGRVEHDDREKTDGKADREKIGRDHRRTCTPSARLRTPAPTYKEALKFPPSPPQAAVVVPLVGKERDRKRERERERRERERGRGRERKKQREGERERERDKERGREIKREGER